MSDKAFKIETETIQVEKPDSNGEIQVSNETVSKVVEDFSQVENINQVKQEAKEEEDKMKRGGMEISDLRSDGEAFTAFVMLFHGTLNVFKKEADKIKTQLSQDKLAIYGKLEEQLKDNQGLNKELLDKLELSEKTQKLVTDVAEEIKNIDSVDAIKEKFAPINVFKDIVKDSKKNLDSVKSTNISQIMATGLMETLEEPTKDTDKELDKDVLKDTEKVSDFERQRNTQKVRAR